MVAKSLFFLAVVLALQAPEVRATILQRRTSNAVVAAELSFGTSCLWFGVENGTRGYQGKRSLGWSLVGIAMGASSLMLGTRQDAGIPTFDVVAGLVAIGGSALRIPRSAANEAQLDRHASRPAAGLGRAQIITDRGIVRFRVGF